ncbi:MAG: TIGR00730 family Rossman fold protein [Alphaproteobacteria bacterium]|nr:TIGR00730 family Rossman fold protein [Alphaproteobacteria bacterium]
MRQIKSVCVYCGSSAQVDRRHREAATRLGALLAANGIALVYGGGRVGLMGLMADACLQAGGAVVGVIPEFLRRWEVGHGAVTELVVVDNMHQRKQTMFDRSDGFAILPGGLGTLDETFEILTWKQLRLHDKPIALIDVAGYWAPFTALFDHVIAENFAKPEMRDLLTVVPDVDDLLPALERAQRPLVGPETKWM